MEGGVGVKRITRSTVEEDKVVEKHREVVIYAFLIPRENQRPIALENLRVRRRERWYWMSADWVFKC